MHIGLDLGTSTVQVFVPKRGVILNEPTVVAMDRNSNRILAVGNQAREMLGRTPANIAAVRPLRDGVVADLEATEALVAQIISKVKGWFPVRPQVTLAVPSRVTTVERRALTDTVLAAGAASVVLVDKPLAAALGAGLAIDEPLGTMVIDFGGGTTDAAVLSMGSVVVGECIRLGGDRLDEALMKGVRKTHNLLIGQTTAEEVKRLLGTAYPLNPARRMDVHGLGLVDGLPRTAELTEDEIREALKDPLTTILDGLSRVLEQTPPELCADIEEHGIVLTGGGCQLQGLPELLSEYLGVLVRRAEYPEQCVARGVGSRAGAWAA